MKLLLLLWWFVVCRREFLSKVRLEKCFPDCCWKNDVTVRLLGVSACTCKHLSPAPQNRLASLKVQIVPSMSQPIRYGSDDLMSGWAPYLMLDITTLPPLVLMLLLTNLLRYRGPTIVKPVFYLESGPWAWALDDSRQELCCLVEVPPPLPSLYKSLEPPVTSGEADWTAEGMYPHHVLGTSQVWAHALTCTLVGEAWTPIALLGLCELI